MADEDKDKEKSIEITPPSRSAKNPIVGLFLVINSALLITVALMKFKAHEKEAKRPNIEEIVSAQMHQIKEEGEAIENGEKEEKKEGLLMPMETFTANLAQGDGPRRYIRLDSVLKFSAESKEEEFKARKPQIRDAIISILNSKRPEDLLKVEGKAYLKEEMKAAINSFLIDGQVDDIFYIGLQIN